MFLLTEKFRLLGKSLFPHLLEDLLDLPLLLVSVASELKVVDLPGEAEVGDVPHSTLAGEAGCFCAEEVGDPLCFEDLINAEAFRLVFSGGLLTLFVLKVLVDFLSELLHASPAL